MEWSLSDGFYVMLLKDGRLYFKKFYVDAEGKKRMFSLTFSGNATDQFLNKVVKIREERVKLLDDFVNQSVVNEAAEGRSLT